MSDKPGLDNAYELETAEQTLAHYRAWAQTYDREVGEENGYAQPARTAEALARHVTPSQTAVLDAGCGSGLSGLALVAAGFGPVDGCDFSPEMLELARAKGIYRELWEADLNQPLRTIADGAYDAVTAVGVFSFGHVAPEACRQLLRVTKPGGWLVIALNEKYWDKGDLAAELDRLETGGRIEVVSREYGDHLPGHGLNGWVIVARKT